MNILGVITEMLAPRYYRGSLRLFCLPELKTSIPIKHHLVATGQSPSDSNPQTNDPPGSGSDFPADGYKVSDASDRWFDIGRRRWTAGKNERRRQKVKGWPGR